MSPGWLCHRGRLMHIRKCVKMCFCFFGYGPLYQWTIFTSDVKCFKSSICYVPAHPHHVCLYWIHFSMGQMEGERDRCFPRLWVCLFACVCACVCVHWSESVKQRESGRKMDLIWKEKQSQGNPLRNDSVVFNWASRSRWPVVILTK